MKYLILLNILLLLSAYGCKKDDKAPLPKKSIDCRFYSQILNDTSLYVYFFNENNMPVMFINKNLLSNDSTVTTYTYNGKTVLLSDGNRIFLNENDLEDSATFKITIAGSTNVYNGYRKSFYNANKQLIKQISEFKIGSTLFKFEVDNIWQSNLLVQRIEKVQSSLSGEFITTRNYKYNSTLKDQSLYWLYKFGFTGYASILAIDEENTTIAGTTTNYKYLYKHDLNGFVTNKTIVDLSTTDTITSQIFEWSCR
ncbi:MAG: hypothetical protein ACK4K9_08485 [Bacteroidia bacterium]